MTNDPRCTRCGCQLKVETVQVPVYVLDQEDRTRQTVDRYETREEVSDCPRCNGAY